MRSSPKVSDGFSMEAVVAQKEREVAGMREIEQVSSGALAGIQTQNRSLEQKLQFLSQEYLKL